LYLNTDSLRETRGHQQQGSENESFHLIEHEKVAFYDEEERDRDIHFFFLSTSSIPRQKAPSNTILDLPSRQSRQ
jgi:hypothetical protein